MEGESRFRLLHSLRGVAQLALRKVRSLHLDSIEVDGVSSARCDGVVNGSIGGHRGHVERRAVVGRDTGRRGKSVSRRRKPRTRELLGVPTCRSRRSVHLVSPKRIRGISGL